MRPWTYGFDSASELVSYVEYGVLGRVNIRGHLRPYEMISGEFDGQWYPGMVVVWVFPTFVLQMMKTSHLAVNDITLQPRRRSYCFEIEIYGK